MDEIYKCPYLWRVPFEENFYSHRAMLLETLENGTFQYLNFKDGSKNTRNWVEVEFITFGEPVYG